MAEERDEQEGGELQAWRDGETVRNLTKILPSCLDISGCLRFQEVVIK